MNIAIKSAAIVAPSLLLLLRLIINNFFAYIRQQGLGRACAVHHSPIKGKMALKNKNAKKLINNNFYLIIF